MTTPVKDQKSCGSCWAFSAVSALESFMKIKGFEVDRLSEQELVDCSKENFGCNGGLMDLAFDYINENDSQQDKTSYLLSELNFNINENNNVYFSTRENKEKKLTEYYNMIYQYKIDCLAASVEYSKNYYDDRDIKPEENIFLKLTIIPFGETSSPNIKN